MRANWKPRNSLFTDVVVRCNWSEPRDDLSVFPEALFTRYTEPTTAATSLRKGFTADVAESRATRSNSGYLTSTEGWRCWYGKVFVVYSRGNGSTALGFVFTVLFTTFRPLFKTGDTSVFQNTVADENISTFVIENFYVFITRASVLYKIFQNVSEKTSADVGKHVLPLWIELSLRTFYQFGTWKIFGKHDTWSHKYCKRRQNGQTRCIICLWERNRRELVIYRETTKFAFTVSGEADEDLRGKNGRRTNKERSRLGNEN